MRELESYDDKNFFMEGVLPNGTKGTASASCNAAFESNAPEPVHGWWLGKFMLKVHNGVETDAVYVEKGSLLCFLPHLVYPSLSFYT